MKQFEFLPHTADLKMRVYGKDLKELFKNALVGMFVASKPLTPYGIITNSGAHYPLKYHHTFAITSPKLTFLLIDFLAEALYLSDAYNQIFLDASFDEFTDTSVAGTLSGMPLERFTGVEIKAVTYHTSEIVQEDSIWQADIVFDI